MNCCRSFLILVTLLCSSCSEKSKVESSWNENTGEFNIPEIGLTYKVPFDIDRWSIADPDNLIPKIKFLGVDNQNGILVMIVTPMEKPLDIEELKSDDIRKLILDIVSPSPPSIMTEFNHIVNKQEDKWAFCSDYTIVESDDTIHSSNIGYFFNACNTLGGIVVIAPSQEREDSDMFNFIPYLQGLSYLQKSTEH